MRDAIIQALGLGAFGATCFLLGCFWAGRNSTTTTNGDRDDQP